MELFKCKACGGDVIPNEDKYTGKCEYCHSIQTLPKDKNEKIRQILNRANDFRLHYHFDRAIFEYEKVLELDETEPEAHWGLFLSKYGVEYVKDTMTQIYKPTLRRISSISVYDDMDYQATLKYCSFVVAVQYEKDAAEIEQVMKELLFTSAKEEPYDIFISYKELDDVTRQRTNDSYLAHDLYNVLTAEGYKVFFAPKSLIGTKLYEPKIYSAIISAKAMIVLGTKPEYLEGVWVKNEWSRFAELIEKGEDKIIVPVFKNMEATELPSRFSSFQAYNWDDISFIEDVKKVLAQWVKKETKIEFDKNASAEGAYLERGYLALEDKNFNQAEAFFENVLNLNPHNSQAYFGKLMVEMKVNKKEQILTSPQPLKMYKNFEKAVRFAEQQEKMTLLQYEEKVQYTLYEQQYNKAMALINKGNPSQDDYRKAIEILKSINNFKDAKGQEIVCIEKIKELQNKQIAEETERKRKETERLRIEKEKVAERKRKIKCIKIVGFIFVVVACIVGVFSYLTYQYNYGVMLMNCGDYNRAISRFEDLNNFKDSKEKIKECYYTAGLEFMDRGKFEYAYREFTAADGYADSDKYISEILKSVSSNESTICTGTYHTVGLKSDGTVIAVGKNDDGQCDVGNWRDVVAITAGVYHTVGLKSDGTVVATGYNGYGQCNVDSWTDIVAIAAGAQYTIGLKSDGTLVAVGDNDDGQCDVARFSDVVAICSNSYRVTIYQKDGSVYNGGYLCDCNIDDWSDIVAVSADIDKILGIKSDGTVVIEEEAPGQIDISDWDDIVAVSTEEYHTIGLKSDGTVVVSCNGGISYYMDYGQCGVEDWYDIKLPDSK